MERESWFSRSRDRLGLGVVAGLATAALYAEGVLKNGWIEVLLLAPVVWYLAASKRSVRIQNLLLSLTALCLTITAADLGLRPFMGSRLHSTPMTVFTRKLPQLPSVGRWDPQVALTAEAYGDLAAMAGDATLREPRTILFQTDSAGFRNTRPERSIDLLVLGDSFGAGSGTTQDKVLSRVLETQYGWSAYNLSFPACGPWQQYINLAIESPRLTFSRHATVIWLFYTGNDLDDEYGNTWKLKELPWKSGFGAWKVSYKTFRDRSPLHQLTDNLAWRIKRSRDMAANVVKEYLPDGRPMLFLKGQEEWGQRSRAEVEQHHNFPKLLRTMEAMKGLVEEKGLKIVIVVLPTKGEVYPWVLHRRPERPEDSHPSGFLQAVRSACERTRLLCLDAKPYLMQAAGRLWASRGELLWWRDDTHLGERGHEILAQFIVEQILESPAFSLAGGAAKLSRPSVER